MAFCGRGSVSLVSVYLLYRLNLENKVEQFQYWADKFEMLPMYFMCFYGAQNINTVIEVNESCNDSLGFAMQFSFILTTRFISLHLCGLSLLVLFSAPKGFSPGIPVFPSPQKPTFDLICVDC